MNNISFPDTWLTKKDKFITLKWNVIEEDGNPKYNDVYTVTIKTEGVTPFTTTIEFRNGEWLTTLYPKESIIAWLTNPKPFV